MAKTALVTGANGFIGHHLANELCDRGYRVTAVDNLSTRALLLNKKINLILGDIRATPSYFGKSFDVIYHLAALRSLPESFVQPRNYIDTNIFGTYNIVSSFPKSRIVFASSSAAAEYKSVYGTTKRCAEHFMNMHHNSVSIRFMNIFGEGEIDTQFVIPAFCRAIKYKQKAIINGDGKLKRDFTYVHDLTDAIIAIGESKMKGQTEVGYGEPISIIDLYKTIATIAKVKPNFKLGPPRKGDMKLTCSKYKIREPRFGFVEGLRRTVRWYLGNKEF